MPVVLEPEQNAGALSPDAQPLPPMCNLPLYRWQALGFVNGKEATLGWLEGRWMEEAFGEGVAIYEEFEDLDEESAEKQLPGGEWEKAAWFPRSEREARGENPLPRLWRPPLDTHDH